MLRSDHGQQVQQPAPVVPPAEPVRVLIVDDNHSFAGLLSSALDSDAGITCVGTASSAAEGYARVAELAPSVVVMDLMMPGLDGLAATRELRRISPGTAVAVVSAHRTGDWVARAEAAGASAYIPKGGSLPEMIEVLKAACPGPMIVAPSLRRAQPEQRLAPRQEPASGLLGRTARTALRWRSRRNSPTRAAEGR